MTLYWKFRMRPLAVVLAIAVLPFAGPATDDVSAAALPKDPCALITPVKIKAALDANSEIGSGVPDTSMLPLGVGCTYTWGPRTKEWGQSALIQETGSGLAIEHSAARGGELVHLVSSACLVCVVRRTSETRQPRAPDRLPLNRPSPHTCDRLGRR